MGREVRGEARVSEFELAQCNLYLYAHLPLSSSHLFPPLSFSLPFSHLSFFPLQLCTHSWILPCTLDTGELYSVDGQCYFLFITRHTVVATLVQNREVDSALCGKDY